MHLHSIAVHTGARMPDVHKTTSDMMRLLASHTLWSRGPITSRRLVTLMFLPDNFRCRSQVEFVDASILSLSLLEAM